MSVLLTSLTEIWKNPGHFLINNVRLTQLSANQNISFSLVFHGDFLFFSPSNDQLSMCRIALFTQGPVPWTTWQPFNLMYVHRRLPMLHISKVGLKLRAKWYHQGNLENCYFPSSYLGLK